MYRYTLCCLSLPVKERTSESLTTRRTNTHGGVLHFTLLLRCWPPMQPLPSRWTEAEEKRLKFEEVRREMEKTLELYKRAAEEAAKAEVEAGLGECAANLIPKWMGLGQSPTLVYSGLPNSFAIPLCFSNAVMQALAASTSGLASALTVTTTCLGPHDEGSTAKLLASFALCAAVCGAFEHSVARLACFLRHICSRSISQDLIFLMILTWHQKLPGFATSVPSS